MKVFITGTEKVEHLSIIDPKTGVDYITDFVASDAAIEQDAERGGFVCEQATFDWWAEVVTDNQALVNRIHQLKHQHGSQAVDDVIESAGWVDLEHYAANAHAELDEVFGVNNA